MTKAIGRKVETKWNKIIYHNISNFQAEYPVKNGIHVQSPVSVTSNNFARFFKKFCFQKLDELRG